VLWSSTGWFVKCRTPILACYVGSCVDFWQKKGYGEQRERREGTFRPDRGERTLQVLADGGDGLSEHILKVAKKDAALSYVDVAKNDDLEDVVVLRLIHLIAGRSRFLPTHTTTHIVSRQKYTSQEHRNQRAARRGTESAQNLGKEKTVSHIMFHHRSSTSPSDTHGQMGNRILRK